MMLQSVWARRVCMQIVGPRRNHKDHYQKKNTDEIFSAHTVGSRTPVDPLWHENMGDFL